MSILRQTAVVAKEKPGDGKQCNEENGTHSNVKVDWLAMFERRDRAGSGKAKIQDLEAVLEEVRNDVPFPRAKARRIMFRVDH